MELTGRQLVLLKYLELYDSLYEMDEVKRPGEDIICNDKELDYWLEQYKMEVYNDLVKYYKQMGKNYGGITNHNPRYVIGGEDV